MRLRTIVIVCLVTAVLGFAAPLLGIDLRALWNWKLAETPSQKAVSADSKASEVVAMLDVVDDSKPIEDGGFQLADEFTGTMKDSGSLEELRQAIDDRVDLGLSVLGGEIDQLMLGPSSETQELLVARNLFQQFGILAIYSGQFEDATHSFERALELALFMDLQTKELVELHALLGVVALRRGEVDNNLGRDKPMTHRFPTPTAGIQTVKEGYREAIKQFQEAMKGEPNDLRLRWLLNIARMKAGDYPARVAPEVLIPVEKPNAEAAGIRFEDISRRIGLQDAGPNLAGVGLFDDFDGDAFPDLFINTLNTAFGSVFYRNTRKGAFEDRAGTLGLENQVYVKNGAAADYDNDGLLDIFLVRGGGERPFRPTLLKNLGNGAFRDDTLLAGLIEPIAGEAAVWGDYNNDGYVDLFVVGEFRSTKEEFTESSRPDLRNRCRLYQNLKDGTFRDVAGQAGVENLECAKGAAWGDIDEDGDLDLFVANLNGPSRLYRNNGGGRFQDAAEALGIIGIERAASCWFWDFDNDGHLDLFVNDVGGTLAEMVEARLGNPTSPDHHPRLFRNLGTGRFTEIGAEIGLDRVKLPMGCNFADIDNDGYLDVFISGGFNAVESLVPSVLLRNAEGERFEDISIASNASLLNKSHSVSFADFDADGDLDLFLQCGGIVPGDQSYNLLLQNNSPRRPSLQIKLHGTKANRSALGARIKAAYKTSAGESRTLYRTVGDNSSLGGNSLVQSLGLPDAKQVDEIEIQWPGTKPPQRFQNLAANQQIEITEGSEKVKTLQRWSLSPAKQP